MADDTDELKARISGLPRELQDQIRNEIFTAEPGTRHVTLEKGTTDRPLFKPPDSVALLSISHATRRQFAENYFGGSGAVFVLSETKCCINWLKHMAPDHKDLLQDIRICGDMPGWGLDELFHDLCRGQLRLGGYQKPFKLGPEDQITGDLKDYRPKTEKELEGEEERQSAAWDEIMRGPEVEQDIGE